MKLKKLLAGVTAAAMAIGLVAVTSLTASAAVDTTVTVNTSYDNLGNIIFETNGDYSVNDQDVTCTSYWTQVDRQKEVDKVNVDTEYAAAFGVSSEDGSTQKVTFKADSSLGTIKMRFIIWDNTSSSSIGHEVNIDLSNAENSVLNVQLIPKGDIATEKTNGWYYAQEAEVKYLSQDTTVYKSKSYAPERTNEANIFFDGTWDLSKAVGPNARIEFTFENDDASGGFAVCDGSYDKFWLHQLLTSNNGKTSFKISEIEAAGFESPIKIVINGWAGSVPTGMIVYNGSDDELYTPASADPEEVEATVTPDTVTVHSVSAADQAADVEALIEVEVGDLTIDEDFTYEVEMTTAATEDAPSTATVKVTLSEEAAKSYVLTGEDPTVTVNFETLDDAVYQGYTLDSNTVSVTATASDTLETLKEKISTAVKAKRITLKGAKIGDKQHNDKPCGAIGAKTTAVNMDEVELAIGEYTVTATVNVAGFIRDGQDIYVPAGADLSDPELAGTDTETIEFTVTVTVPVISEPIEDDPAPAPSGDAIWEGNAAISWSDALQVSADRFADVAAGDKLVFTVTPGENGQLKIMHMGTDWPVLEGFAAIDGYNSEWGVVDVSGSSLEITLTEADVTNLKANGLVVGGQNCTVTKIAKAGGTVTPPEPTPPEPTPDEPTPDTPSAPEATVPTETNNRVGDGGSVPTEVNTGAAFTGTRAMEEVSRAKAGDTVNIVMTPSMSEGEVIAKIAYKKNVTVNLKYSAYSVSINSDDVAEDFEAKGFYSTARFLSADEKAAFAGAKELRQVSVKNLDGVEKATITVTMRGGSKGMDATALLRTSAGKYKTVETGKVADDRTFSFEITRAGNYVVYAGKVDM